MSQQNNQGPWQGPPPGYTWHPETGQWQPPPNQGTPPPKKKHTACKVIGAVLAAIVLIVIITSVTHSGGNSARSGDPAPQTNTQPKSQPKSQPNPEDDPAYLSYSIFKQVFKSQGYPLHSVKSGDSCVKVGDTSFLGEAVGVVDFHCGYNRMDSYYNSFESSLIQGDQLWYKATGPNWRLYSTSKDYVWGFAKGYGHEVKVKRVK